MHGRGVGQDRPAGARLVGLRKRLERLEREARGETVKLPCRGCEEETTVDEDTDPALPAHECQTAS